MYHKKIAHPLSYNDQQPATTTDSSRPQPSHAAREPQPQQKRRDQQHRRVRSLTRGCHLEPKLSPATLRSSLHALLGEMSRSGNPDNTRVLKLKDTEDLVLGAGDYGDADAESGGTRLLRHTLLPLYHVRTRQNRLDSCSAVVAAGRPRPPGGHPDGARTVVE
jgi:hypothetical protein